MSFVIIFGILGFLFYLISSSSFQTKLVSRVTKNINSLINGKIEIGNFILYPNGFMKLENLILFDHQSDTLFYAKNIESNLTSNNNFLKKISFSNSTIENFYLNISQYRNEKENSLVHFP